ncbi:MAG: hypothetical protein ACLRU3_05400 [Paraclostridium sp.]
MINIFLGIWVILWGIKLNKTKNLKGYTLDNPKKIKDKDGYINLFSKVYVINGIVSITLGLIMIADKFYLNLSLEIVSVLVGMLLLFIFLEAIIINKKRCKLIH